MVDCSVIIPHYNQVKALKKCLDSLSAQKVHNITYEIIVVDNGSDSELLFVTEQYNSTLLKLDSPKNPYACRNLGVQNSNGRILFFADAKCTPSQAWLQSGYEFIQNNDISIAGGPFEVQAGQNISSKVFPLMYLDTEKNVAYNYGLPGGNMFVKRSLFDKIGLFKTLSVSGNDIEFSKRAIKEGYTIGFSPYSGVSYPEKSYTDLLVDVKKYGEGSIFVSQKSWRSLMWYLFPTKPITLMASISRRKYHFTTIEKVHVWGLIWYAKIHFAIGMFNGLMAKRTINH